MYLVHNKMHENSSRFVEKNSESLWTQICLQLERFFRSLFPYIIILDTISQYFLVKDMLRMFRIIFGKLEYKKCKSCMIQVYMYVYLISYNKRAESVLLPKFNKNNVPKSPKMFKFHVELLKIILTSSTSFLSILKFQILKDQC